MLDVKNLKTTFHTPQSTIIAVDDVSFSIQPNQMVGLVGESGSGKSVTALSIMNLLPPNGQIESGEILWEGKNIRTLSKQDQRKIRGGEIGLIFQNPLAALNPVFTIANQMVETIMLHQEMDKDSAREKAIELLDKVHIKNPRERIDHYPHEFSLGMCQRMMIAMTLSMHPKLLIADEPTASLDVTIQAQILDLINEIKENFNLSILFISHDLSVVAENCDHILVMYHGKLVEQGSPKDIFGNPQDEYTKRLISAIPLPPQY